ncbi:U3 small nucleolar ribonucleoprotein protein MPP10 [Macrosteles quadrilineatus]|uniref:U3 small nucleolar ribonucleoprotein protein MPP10 n=1 Tax=Macrosteles quadrilineatus TaxID=74068 RepID=UPI0023E30CD2|nr:U3 small nucleolar ribonucleoprotein protein MPP10 [Macrosteles quadrilineatus]
MEGNLNEFLDNFSKASKKPYEFLSVQENLSESIKTLIKDIYDFTKNKEESKSKNALPKLIIEQFDDEQIWQELELQNNIVADHTIENVSQFAVKRDQLKFPLTLKCNKIEESPQTSASTEQENGLDQSFDNEEIENDDNYDEDDDEEFDGAEESEFEEGDDITEPEEKSNKKGKLKPSIVDDKFFKLSELELFLQNEEKNEDKATKESESIDLFNNIDDGPVDYKYSDFFETPYNDGGDLQDETEVKEDNDAEDESMDDEDVEFENDEMDNNEDDESTEDSKKKKVRFSLLGSDDDSSDTEEDSIKNEGGSSKKNKKDEIKSSLELRQERLGKVIEKLEEDALTEKPWQLKGEVTATARPQNSLLEEAVDFDLSVRPAPLMTEEVTMRLEDIIMQRIKDKAWDDVERKVKPVETPSEFKKKLALDQEKSKLSLAEVYEQEFIKQRDAATSDDVERQETEPAAHVEVRSMLHSLFNKLDALSNYHYTPRPVAPELKVVTNVSAINMEEVAPVTVADSALLAPEEVKGRKLKGEPMSKEERTETDKKRARRLKKTKQRQRAREKARAVQDVTKINPGLGNKYAKLKAVKQVLDSSANISKMEESREKMVKSSTSFFNKLQDEVKSQIKSKTSPFAKKKDKLSITAKKLKL